MYSYFFLSIHIAFVYNRQNQIANYHEIILICDVVDNTKILSRNHNFSASEFLLNSLYLYV